MKTYRKVYPLILGLILILLPIGAAACTGLLPAKTGSSLDVQSQVDTQVAATLVGYLVQTKVAANLTSNQAPQEASAQQAPTATPVPPTETPLPPPPTATSVPPTETPLPPPPATTAAVAAAAIVSAPAPQISAYVNTNCRQGPSTYYHIDGYLLKGATSYVYGRDPGSHWWYIQNPNNKSANCWVWSESTVVTGDTSSVPVTGVDEYAETSARNLFTSYNYGSYYGDYGYGYDGYGYCDSWGNWCTPYYHSGKVYCLPNPGYCGVNNWWNWSNGCNYWPYKCKCSWPNNCNKLPVCPPIGGNPVEYCAKHPKCCK